MGTHLIQRTAGKLCVHFECLISSTLLMHQHTSLTENICPTISVCSSLIWRTCHVWKMMRCCYEELLWDSSYRWYSWGNFAQILTGWRTVDLVIKLIRLGSSVSQFWIWSCVVEGWLSVGHQVKTLGSSVGQFWVTDREWLKGGWVLMSCHSQTVQLVKFGFGVLI